MVGPGAGRRELPAPFECSPPSPRNCGGTQDVEDPDQCGHKRGVPVRGSEGEYDSSCPRADGNRLKWAGGSNGGFRRPDLCVPTRHRELQSVQHGRAGARERDGCESVGSDCTRRAGCGEEGSGGRKPPDVSDGVGIDAARGGGEPSWRPRGPGDIRTRRRGHHELDPRGFVGREVIRDGSREDRPPPIQRRFLRALASRKRASGSSVGVWVRSPATEVMTSVSFPLP